MEGERIIDIGTNPFLVEKVPQVISLRNPDDILVIDMSVVVLDVRDFYAEVLIAYFFEEVIIIRGVLPSLLRPFIKILKLNF